MKKALIIGLAIVTIGIIFGSMYVSSSNGEIRLRNQITAQQDVCKAYYDKLWKVISQKAQVADQYKDAFKEIYPKLIEGRYGNEKGGALMKWIQESNPTFDVSLYKDLSVAIEGEREGFFMEQKKLVDLNAQHRNVRQTWPGSMFIGSRPDIAIIIVTSAKTDEVMKSGQENDIEIFKKENK